MTDNRDSKSSAWNTPDFRPDLAFPKLTEEMVERVRSYAREETFPANVPLFTRSERKVDMFVVLDGEVDVSLQRFVLRCANCFCCAFAAVAP
jgi:thioredoxin reductase (NADPH)